MEIIAVRNLSRRFGSIVAVAGVSFSVGRGEVLGVLGPNGAGKSTTMRMLAGFLPPTAGTALINGIDVSRRRIEAQRHIGYLPEGAPAYPEMTPAGFLDFTVSSRGLSRPAIREAKARVADQVGLETVWHQPIETLSKGYRRRVALAAALIHDPPVLILDEPTDGLDPNQKHEVRRLITAMASDKAILISTQILEEVEAMCSRALIIAGGQVRADATPAALAARDPSGRLDTVFRAITAPEMATTAAEAA